MNTSLRHFATDIMPVDGGIIVSLKGELDAHSSVVASNVLEGAAVSGMACLLIDCSQLSYISSAGIGVILSVYHLCLLKQTNLTLFGMQPKIRNVFEVLGMDKVLNVAASKEEAMALAATSRRA
ncbi:STAS domain-containing protein [Pontibacter russatus]|uniref:STAS domain-containing protein n=1 Tax=Pontibacter russatus TaxID=2694929 RepID=UPI001F1913C9|nr:STAS domain-containing protein [Pontibacter russatus]